MVGSLTFWVQANFNWLFLLDALTLKSSSLSLSVRQSFM